MREGGDKERYAVGELSALAGMAAGQGTGVKPAVQP